MTFDYLNKVFNLPADYLQNSLQITDKNYPYITISHYSREERLGPASLATQVQIAIYNYLIGQK